jgi:UPF0755 protein
VADRWNESLRRYGLVGGKRPWLRWLLIALVCLIVVAAGVAIDLYRQFQPPAPHGSVKVTVSSGESVSGIATELRAKGLVKNAWLFRMYVRQTQAGPHIRAGQYLIPSGMTIPQILEMFENGDTIDTSIHVTFPEGYTVEQMAQRLKADHVCSSAAFLNEVEHGQFSEPFLKDVQTRKGTRFRLEGYLFPDTYDFGRGESAHMVVDEMLQSFQQNVVPLIEQTKGSKQSLTDVVTIASMVESEAKVEGERPAIASVIYNRLKQNPPMKLQIDATVEYALGRHTNIVTYHDLQVNSPYNTYLNPGLPPGPICNPGMESIEAALHPKHTSYLYYVAKNDGTGEHYFATTMGQQTLNELKSQQNLKK